MKYIFANILALIVMNSCYFHGRAIKNLDESDYTKAIISVLKYDNNKIPQINNTFYIRQIIQIDTLECNYMRSNFYYQFSHLDTISFPSFAKISIDQRPNYKQIQKLLDKKWILPLDSLMYPVRVKILSNIKYPKGTLYFSPLIPFNKKNTYSLWLTIESDFEPAYLSYQIEKINSDFIVTNEPFWSNECIWYPSQDFIRHLK
jgi:hypothetical protein